MLSSEQIKLRHVAVTKIAQDEDFHNQAEKLPDFYQIEVTYSELRMR
jgi:hypothetical protein